MTRLVCIMTGALGLIIGCGGGAVSQPGAPPTDDSSGAPPMEIRNKTPEPERTFVPGPTIAPSAELLEWLQAHPDTRVRLPVVVRFADPHRFAIAEAWIGAAATPRPDDALMLRLDDLALGISLHDRLANLGAPDDEALVLWLEGFWRESSLPAFDTDEDSPQRWNFSLRAVGEPLDEHELARGDALTIGVEAPPP